MPVYEYYCLDCEDRFTVFHSMNGSCDACEICESENIEKVSANMGDKIDKSKFKTRAGDLVKNHIEETKAAIKQEKSRLKAKVYKDD